jgi:glyceraldehyde-3-phosphate dehydrogenase (NAD(P))
MGLTVAVAGLGTVGTTLVELLLDHGELLGVSRVVVLRRAVPSWDEPAMGDLEARGAVICTEVDDGRPGSNDVAADVDHVFDCGPNGVANARRSSWDAWPRVQSITAQGSETGFGPPFMTGVNGAVIEGARHVQVVSCNTHGTAAVLQALAGDRLEHLVDADVVVVRRSEDLGRHERLVGSTVVARHRDPSRGTHHAVDVARLFATVGGTPQVVSSDATTPTQLLHAFRFCVRVDDPKWLDHALAERIASRPWLATTARFDANGVFEQARRYGPQGRLFAHAVIVANNLMVHGDTVRGWAFVPQEANSLPSTLEAMLRQTGHPSTGAVMATLAGVLARSAW